MVCTFLGDGATSEGDFYEAINLAGVQQAPLIVVCINNGWAISTPVERQTAAETFAAKGAAAGIPGVRVDGNDVVAVLEATREARRRAARGDGPTLLELVTYRMGAHTNSDDPTRYVPADELADWRTRDPIERFANELRRSGSWDDERHEAASAAVEERLERIIERALGARGRSHRRPRSRRRAPERAVAGAARRDRGAQRNAWAHCTDDIVLRRRRRRRTRRERSRRSVVASMTMLAAIRETLLDEMARDERVVLLGEDVGKNGGVFRATDGALERFGPRRVFDTPISESTIVGASVGLSIAGLVPVAEIQFGGFTMQAYHQLVGQLARFRYRSRGRFQCPVTLRSAYGGGVRTPEHHSDSVEAPYTHAPGLSVVVPSNAADAKGLLSTAVRSDDPVIVFEPIPCYRTTCDVPDGEYLVPLGVAREVRAPEDAVVITWGAMVDVAVAASDLVQEQRGARVGVIDLRTLAPLDVDTIVRAAERCRARGRRARGTADRWLRRRGRGDAAGRGLLLVGSADPAGGGRRRGFGPAAGGGLVPARRGAHRRRPRRVVRCLTSSRISSPISVRA